MKDVGYGIFIKTNQSIFDRHVLKIDVLDNWSNLKDPSSLEKVSCQQRQAVSTCRPPYHYHVSSSKKHFDQTAHVLTIVANIIHAHCCTKLALLRSILKPFTQALPAGHVVLSHLIRLHPEDVTFPLPVEAGNGGSNLWPQLRPVARIFGLRKN